MGKLVGNGGPILLLLPALLVLALSPKAIPAAALEQTRAAACAAIAMFLFVGDLHRFLIKFQDVVDPSGHLLVYGCGMLGSVPLVAWALSRVARGRPQTTHDSAPTDGASISSAEHAQKQAEDEAEEGLAAAVAVLVLLVAAFIVYFSAVTAAFFHTWLDTLIPALLIAGTAVALHCDLFVGCALSDGVLPFWAASKLFILVIAAARFFRPLASALQALGIPFNTKHGEALPPISAKTMAVTFAYDVGLVCLYVFWLRVSERPRQKSE